MRHTTWYSSRQLSSAAQIRRESKSDVIREILVKQALGIFGINGHGAIPRRAVQLSVGKETRPGTDALGGD